MPQKHNFRMKLFNLRLSSLRQRFSSMIDHQVVEIKEKPSKVALGCALGLTVNFFPTLGLGFLIAFALATIFRGNQVSATATSLLTAPLIPLKYAFNLLVGSLILASGTGNEGIFELIAGQYALIFKISGFKEQLLSFLDFFGTTFILGAVINASFFGTVLYLGVEILLKKKLKNIPPR